MATKQHPLKKRADAYGKIAKGISGNNPYGDMFGNTKPKAGGTRMPNAKKAPKRK